MNKKLILILVVLVAIGAGFAYLLVAKDGPVSPYSTEEKPTNTSKSSPSSSSSETAGTYTDYSAEKLANTPGTKVLFFHAAWCPQCRQLEADIKANSIPSGVTIFKIDYDTNQTLRQKYGVQLQTTLVKVDDNGNVVQKYVAYDEPTFAALKEELL